MSSETLRRAASLMRERAEAQEVRRWSWTGVGANGYPQRVSADGNAALVAETFNNPDLPYPAAEHIASWHPAVALAVADWLSMSADHVSGRGHACGSCVDQAITVARAYLGEAM